MVTRWHSSIERRDDSFPENITVLKTFDAKDDDNVSEFKFTDDEISDTSNSERKVVL